MGLSKLVNKLKSHSVADLVEAEPAVGGSLLPRQLYQTRYHFGVNFGGCFVGEKWIFHGAFPEGTECELEAVEEGTKNNQNDYKASLEKRWSEYATEDDWKWLHDHGVTAVRIPVGYWHVDGGKYTHATKFERYSDVYSNAWKIFKQKFVEPAASHNIGILVDLHGVPGGANGDAHSGEQRGGQAQFWDNDGYQKLATDALAFIARDLKHYDNIAGIQVVNEAQFSDSAKSQKSFYARAINAIRHEDASVPVVILDGWWPDQWVQWIQSEQKGDRSIGVVVDHHCYRCFDDKDKQKGADQVIDDLEGDLLTNLSDSGNGVDFMVGEWSCVLDGATWDRSHVDDAKRAEIVKRYGQKQLQLIFQRSSALYFWTYKFEAGLGGEWDFRHMVDHGLVAPSVKVPDQALFDEALKGNYDGHVNYWNQNGGGSKYDHDQYKAGFCAAWNEGLEFAKQGALVGRRQAVKLARRAEHVAKHGKLEYLWEWDQGWDKGMEEFSRAATC